MPTNNGESQPQAGDQAAIPQDGAAQPQPSGAPDGSTGPGAGETPGETSAPAPRTYSEAEWNDRQSALDKQVAHSNEVAARAAMTLQTERAQIAEGKARETDARSVEDGDLTKSQADDRARDRARIADNDQLRQIQVNQAQGVIETANVHARVMTADLLAKEFSVDMQALLDHPTTQIGVDNGDKMELLAMRLQIEAQKAALMTPREDETFDGGGGGGTGAAVNTDGLSPTELATLAYGDVETNKRNKNRR